jgi:hypothetical protein
MSALRPRLAALSLLVFWAAILSTAGAWADDFLLIHNASNDVTSIPKGDLFKVYTGETKIIGGSVVQTVIGSEDSGELAWLAGLFDMRSKDLLSRIKQQVFSGEMRRPIVAKTTDEAVAAVQANRGGVAVIPAGAAASLPHDVAVLPLK